MPKKPPEVAKWEARWTKRTPMDDCVALEETLDTAQRVLADLEKRAASYTSLTLPSSLKLELEDKRQEVDNLKAKLETAQHAQQKAQQKTQPAVQAEINRSSVLRQPVPAERYIERQADRSLRQDFAAALSQPQQEPLLFNLYGIGGVGKTTLLSRIQILHRHSAHFLRVCFAKTARIDNPLQLMRRLHQQAKTLTADTAPDRFAQQDQQFESALYQLSQRAPDGSPSSDEDARKVTHWFKRWIWLSPPGFTRCRQSRPRDSSGTGFAAFTALGEDPDSQQDWIQQRVRHHPHTRDQPELQALMLDPVTQLTQAFSASLIQIAQQHNRPLVLVLDTYEKAQPYLNQWLWQSLVEDTALATAPVRLLVVGRRPLTADESWRKLNQDRQLLYEVELTRFKKEETDQYLPHIGITHGRTLDKIRKVTQGLPYYLNWVREQREKGKELDFSKGNQAIADLLLQGLDNRQRQLLQAVACCRWFDRATLRHLLGSKGLDWQPEQQLDATFDGLKQSDFIEFSQGHYRLDDVARDVLRHACIQDDPQQFRDICAVLADYFQQQADTLVARGAPYPDAYEDEDWCAMTAERLYYGLLGRGREGLRQYVEQVFAAAYLGKPAVFADAFAFIEAEIGDDRQNLLPATTRKFLDKSGTVLRFGWRFLGWSPKRYRHQLEGEKTVSEAEIEASIRSLLGYVGDLQESLSQFAGWLFKVLRSPWLRERTDLVLQAEGQIESLLARCRPQLIHGLFSSLGNLLKFVERYEDSLAYYQKALELDRGNAIALLGQGEALLHLERYEEALESCQQAIDLDLQFAGAWINRGTALYSLERYEEALESCQQAIDLDPNSVEAWLNRGDTLQNLQQYEQSLVAYDRALAIDAKNPSAQNSRALTLSLLQEFDRAITAIDRAIELKPQDVLYRANRGIILARAGRAAAALADCDQAIQQKPNVVFGHYARACCQALQANLDAALASLEQALAIAPRKTRQEARCNPDFDALRNDPRFQALIDPGSAST